MEMPNRIIEELDVMMHYELLFEDWMSVKKYLLRSIPSEMRTLFSKRNAFSKKQTLNAFEKNVIIIYEARTGKKLRLP